MVHESWNIIDCNENATRFWDELQDFLLQDFLLQFNLPKSDKVKMVYDLIWLLFIFLRSLFVIFKIKNVKMSLFSYAIAI